MTFVLYIIFQRAKNQTNRHNMKFVSYLICFVLLLTESFASSPAVKDVESDATSNYSEQNNHAGENEQRGSSSIILPMIVSNRGLENSTSDEAVEDEFNIAQETQEEEGMMVDTEETRALIQKQEQVEQDNMKGKIRGVRKAMREKRDLHWYHGGSGKGKGGSSSYHESYSKGKGSRSYRYDSSSSDDGYYHGGHYNSNIPSKGSTYYPAKGSTYYPAKGSTYSYPAKGSTYHSSKGSTYYPSKGSSSSSKGSRSSSKGSRSSSKGGSKGATYNSKGSW